MNPWNPAWREKLVDPLDRFLPPGVPAGGIDYLQKMREEENKERVRKEAQWEAEQEAKLAARQKRSPLMLCDSQPGETLYDTAVRALKMTGEENKAMRVKQTALEGSLKRPPTEVVDCDIPWVTSRGKRHRAPAQPSDTDEKGVASDMVPRSLGPTCHAWLKENLPAPRPGLLAMHDNGALMIDALDSMRTMASSSGTASSSGLPLLTQAGETETPPPSPGLPEYGLAFHDYPGYDVASRTEIEEIEETQVELNDEDCGCEDKNEEEPSEATELEEALNEKWESADEYGCAGTQTGGGDEDDIEDKEEDEVPNTQC